MAASSSLTSPGDYLSWSSLPHDLLFSVVLHLPTLSDFFSFASVCRSWRSFLRSSSSVHLLLSSRFLLTRPPLLLHPSHLRFYALLSSQESNTNIINLRLPSHSLDYYFLGYSHGKLIFLNNKEISNLVISDPFTGTETTLAAPLPPDEFRFYFNHYFIYYAAVLTAPPSSPSSSVLVLSPKECVYRNLSSADSLSPWSTLPISPPSSFSSIISFNANQHIYALDYSTRNLFQFTLNSTTGQLSYNVFKVDGFILMQTAGWKDNTYYDEYRFGPQLAELNGELLLVLLVLNGDWETGSDRIDRIDIYRMDFKRVKWVQAEYVLDDHALFLDSCGRCPVFCAEPERWGGRRSCLYVAGPDWSSWREFPLDQYGRLPSGRSPFPYSNIAVRKWPECIWVYPSFFF